MGEFFAGFAVGAGLAFIVGLCIVGAALMGWINSGSH